MNIYCFSGRLTEVYFWEKQIQWILSFIFSRNSTVSASFVHIFAHLYNYKEKRRKICMLILMSFASEQWERSGWGKIANFISLSIFFWWGPFFNVFFEFVTILLLFFFFYILAFCLWLSSPGIEPVPSELEGTLLTTGLLGKFLDC